MISKLTALRIVIIGCLTAASLAFGQTVDSSVGGGHKPVKTGNARFGDPTSTGRGFQNHIYGVVKKVDKTSLVLDKTEFGDDQVFTLIPKTRFIHDGKPSSLEQIKVGDQIWVQTKRDKKSGNLLAQKVLTGVLPVN